MHANKIYVAKIGIGMIIPEIVEDFPFGHMWVYWTKGEYEYYPAYRGYYPLREDIPPSALESKIKMLRFFARNSVRGRYQVDFLARDLMENVGEKNF